MTASFWTLIPLPELGFKDLMFQYCRLWVMEKSQQIGAGVQEALASLCVSGRCPLRVSFGL